MHTHTRIRPRCHLGRQGRPGSRPTHSINHPVIRSDTIRDVLLKRLVLESEVYALVDSNAVKTMAESVRRVGILHEPVFQVLADGAMKQLTGRKRVACALLLRFHSVRLRILDCDDQDAELIIQTERSYQGDALEQSTARRKMNELIARVSPALPADKPVIRMTPKRAAREMLALQLSTTTGAVSARQQRQSLLQRENERMARHPEDKPYVFALRAARSLRYHLGSAKNQAESVAMAAQVAMLERAIEALNASWPKGPCCMNADCPKCGGRGWIAGQRVVRRGRPPIDMNHPRKPEPEPYPPKAPKPATPLDWIDW